MPWNPKWVNKVKKVYLEEIDEEGLMRCSIVA